MRSHTTNSDGPDIYTRLAAFFVLSCALAWWPYLIGLLTGNDSWANHFSIGPLLAAALIIAISEGKAGLRDWWRRMKHVRGPLRYYAIAALVPAAIPLLTAALAILAGADAPAGGAWLEKLPLALALILPMALVGGPIGEELAFRGWGQHRLQSRVSPLAAALLIGCGVVLWHAPLLLRGDIPLSIIVALPAVSVVYAWLYRMSDTVWTVVVTHTAHNVVSSVYVGEVFDGSAADLRIGILTAIYVAWAAYIWLRYGASLDGRARATATGSHAPAQEQATVTAS
jgi:membrane protease YdiL (CAAX protease family)